MFAQKIILLFRLFFSQSIEWLPNLWFHGRKRRPIFWYQQNASFVFFCSDGDWIQHRIPALHTRESSFPLVTPSLRIHIPYLIASWSVGPPSSRTWQACHMPYFKYPECHKHNLGVLGAQWLECNIADYLCPQPGVWSTLQMQMECWLWSNTLFPWLNKYNL